jgi:hypothetical protein
MPNVTGDTDAGTAPDAMTLLANRHRLIHPTMKLTRP